MASKYRNHQWNAKFKLAANSFRGQANAVRIISAVSQIHFLFHHFLCAFSYISKLYSIFLPHIFLVCFLFNFSSSTFVRVIFTLFFQFSPFFHYCYIFYHHLRSFFLFLFFVILPLFFSALHLIFKFINLKRILLFVTLRHWINWWINPLIQFARSVQSRRPNVWKRWENRQS